MRVCALTLMATVVLTSLSVHAEEIFPFYRGVRALGMGGAAVATVNDETSLFLNPAGLGRIRGPYVVLASPELELNMPTNGVVGPRYEYMNLYNNPDYLMTQASLQPDTHLHSRYQTMTAFVTTNFGLGLIGKYNWDVEFISATNKYRIDYVNDWGAALGYCVRLFDGRIKIGASGKLINRVSIAKDLASNTTTRTMDTLVSEGGGVGWDSGILLTGPWVWLPSIGVVAHDIGNTNFNLTNGYFYKPTTRPEPQKQSIDAAISVSPIHGKRIRSTWTAEYRDVQNPDQVDMYRRIHAGVELNIADILFLRAGMNQRYYTAGFEFNLGGFQLQLATYGEEIGTPTATREDRRYVGQAALRF